MGRGVGELVLNFFPAAKAIRYSPEVKARLVLKAKSDISKARLEMDAGRDIDLAQSFMGIKRIMTAGGQQATSGASRTAQTGHADLAWACMHALDFEPLEGITGANQSSMEIF